MFLGVEMIYSFNGYLLSGPGASLNTDNTNIEIEWGDDGSE